MRWHETVQSEKCTYHSESLFSGKGLPSRTALEPSGERKNILQDWVQKVSRGEGNSVIGLTSNLCEAQGVIQKEHTHKVSGRMEILFRTRKSLEFCLLEVVSFFLFFFFNRISYSPDWPLTPHLPCASLALGS